MEHQLSYVFNVLAQLANCLDSGALIYGVVYFYKKDYKEFQNFYKERRGLKYKTLLWKMSKIHLTAIIAFIVPITLVISIAPPIILTIYVKNTAPYNIDEDLGLSGVIIEWISHFSIFIVRVPMILATLYVRSIWLVAITKMPKVDANESCVIYCEPQFGAEEGIRLKSCMTQTDTHILKKYLNNLIDHYKVNGIQVASIQRIFQGWFVAKWIIFFFEISAFAATSLKPLSDGIHSSNGDQIWYPFTHFLYDIIAFIVIYSCGKLMNYYHAKFYESLEDNLQKHLYDSADFHHWLMQDMTLIRKRNKYQFIPSLFGIDIPMDSPGYAVTILISVFAVVTQFF